MPFHRAFYSTASDARDAATAAVAALTSLWEKRTSEAGATVTSVTPVVGIEIVGNSPLPAASILDASGNDISSTYVVAKLKVTGPDGRAEVVETTMLATELDGAKSAASGQVTITTVAPTKARFRCSIANTVYVDATASVSLPASIFQDPNTGKKYQTTGSTALGVGTNAVAVTEVSAADKNEVTYGTTLEILSPPSGVIPSARVCGMATTTVTVGDDLRDAIGRKFEVRTTTVVGDASARSIAGDAYGDVAVVRDTTDTNTDLTALDVGESLSFVTAPAGCASTAEIVTSGVQTIAKGSVLTRVVGSATHEYELTSDVVFSDRESETGTVRSRKVGSTYDLAITDILTFDPAPAGVVSTGSVTSVQAARDIPLPYDDQVIGGEVEWASRVHQALDGRWIADVYTLPFGS